MLLIVSHSKYYHTKSSKKTLRKATCLTFYSLSSPPTSLNLEPLFKLTPANISLNQMFLKNVC